MRATEEDFELDEWTCEEIGLIVTVVASSAALIVGTMLYVALWLR